MPLTLYRLYSQSATELKNSVEWIADFTTAADADNAAISLGLVNYFITVWVKVDETVYVSP